ncbi:RNA polymerase sigma-70 factor (ECF subfamily) [Chitinophaga skermanii]|uniref:RNA polymerase sigma-70 factor (ECF subfamily) n=1 Tax=Chitinophaga skermanii TaxID=331697 RepID=A0A327Q7B5_9BACT|nr:RNA polymerase sigma-70 factor [Chitinophaga skermanii]RAI99687.1 RNA polymerase sigma-70 factor (ECF subfamily) [Chitinophaga skermanii]
MRDNPLHILFDELFEANKDKVYRFALKLTGSESRADEITQLCFIRLWENIHAVKPGEDVFPLLFVFVKNLVVDEARRFYREQKIMANIKEQHASEEPSTGEPRQLEDKELQQQMRKVIAKMPEQRRQVYILSREKGKSHKEIASQLSLSPTTVRNHIGLAIQFIRQELKTRLAE